MESVALPWVNNNSDSGLPHNFADYDSDTDTYSWSSTTKRLSWMPYLLYITKMICQARGYSYDFSAWQNDEHYKYLLICNVLPDAWEVTPYARVLPHWTVDEYFEKLELFLGGEFTIDHRGKHISFAFTNDVLDSIPTVQLDNVVDEHTTEIKVEDEQCEYLEAVNLVYKSQDNNVWKYYSCDWYIKVAKDYASTQKYDTLNELINAVKPYKVWDGSTGRNSPYDRLFYAADYDRYYCIRPLYKKNNKIYCKLQSLNSLGGRIVDDSDNADENEIEFIPAWIDETEEKYGECVFLDIGSYNETRNGYGTRESAESTDELTTNLITRLMAGEYEQKSEYFDCIYIGYWGGINYDRGLLPHPYIDDIIIKNDWSKAIRIPFSLRLNDSMSTRRTVRHHINPKVKTTFKFLSDTIPDVRAVFLIHGKRYICEKLTATFTAEAGMSQLIKGSFYPLED